MAQLTPEFVEQSGGFTGDLVEKKIEWATEDGNTYDATTFVRPLGYHITRADLTASIRKTDVVAERIASHIVFEDGTPVFTYDQVLKLNGALALALLSAINEVISLGKTTNSQEKTNSSAS